MQYTLQVQCVQCMPWSRCPTATSWLPTAHFGNDQHKLIRQVLFGIFLPSICSASVTFSKSAFIIRCPRNFNCPFWALSMFLFTLRLPICTHVKSMIFTPFYRTTPLSLRVSSCGQKCCSIHSHEGKQIWHKCSAVMSSFAMKRLPCLNIW